MPENPDPTSLEGRVAVVTGAGAGLGRAEAVALARAGANVVLNDLPDAAEEAAEEVRSHGVEALVVAGDVGERATADAMLQAATEKLGGLDVVVNNAGITRDKMLFNMTDEDFDLVLKVHLRGHFLLSRNAASYWRGQLQGDRRARRRRRRQHRLRGVPGRLAGPGELRGGQGRHHRADPVDRARALPRRRARQRDLPSRAHGDDRGRLRRGRVGPGGRPVLARPRRPARRLPRVAGRGADQRPGVRRVRRDGGPALRARRRAALRRHRRHLGPRLASTRTSGPTSPTATPRSASPPTL